MKFWTITIGCIALLNAVIIAMLLFSNRSLTSEVEKLRKETQDSAQEQNTHLVSEERTIPSETKKVEPTKSKGNYTEITETVEQFLTYYYTYTQFGENFSTYEPFLLPSSRETIKNKVTEEKNSINTASFAESDYRSSEIYVSHAEEKDSQVISKVSFSLNSLDGEGKFKELMPMKVSLLIDVTKEGDKHYIKAFRRINDGENR